MQRRSFIVRSIGALAVASTASVPTLARAFSGPSGASVAGVVRYRPWGAIPGGCADRRRRRAMHAGYTRADALVRFAR
jgi:hypothetical protein